MANPVICSKCNMFLGNLYFLNSKINSSTILRKNKVFYIADDKSQYSYAYCQGCWANHAINNPLIRQKTEPAIEANYSLYLNEYAENAQNKKDLVKKNLAITELNYSITDLKSKLSKEVEQNNISNNKYVNEIDMLQNTIHSLRQQSDNAYNKIKVLTDKIETLESNIISKTEENICSLNCLDLLKGNFYKEVKTNDILRDEITYLKTQIENFNNIHSKYAETINTLEDKIIVLQSIINERDTQINSLSDTIEITKKVMKNEYQQNQAQIIKLKQYISDLNEHIENNMTTNETFNDLKVKFEESLMLNNKLVNEIESMRLYYSNPQQNTDYNDEFIDNCDDQCYEGEPWDVNDDKWIIVNFDEININNCDDFIDNNDEHSNDDQTNNLIDNDFIDNNENINQTNNSIDENYSEDNNYNDFVDSTNENESLINNNVIEYRIVNYDITDICSDNHYDSFVDNKSGSDDSTIDDNSESDDTTTEEDSSDDNISEEDSNEDNTSEENSIENNNINCDDFVDSDIIIYKKEIDDEEFNYFIDEPVDNNNDDFIDSEILYEKLQTLHKVKKLSCNNYPLEFNDKSFIIDDIDNEMTDLRDSYHIVQTVKFDEKIFEEYKNKQKNDNDTDYFPKKYTIIHDFI